MGTKDLERRIEELEEEMGDAKKTVGHVVALVEAQDEYLVQLAGIIDGFLSRHEPEEAEDEARDDG